MEWFIAADLVKPHVFKVSTPTGFGTGFLVYRSQDGRLSMIATAQHVIGHAHTWDELIIIEHFNSKQRFSLQPVHRAIYYHPERDTAVILFDSSHLSQLANPLPLIPPENYLMPGSNLAWLGFPVMVPDTLCFFSGMVSALLEGNQSYLVDGISINGVSGGPAFAVLGGSQVFLAGVVTAYWPNQAMGDTRPGLTMVRGVKYFHDLAPTFASLADAKAKEARPDINPSTQDPPTQKGT